MHFDRLTPAYLVRFSLEPTPIVRLRYHSLGQGGTQNLSSSERVDLYKLNPRIFLSASLLGLSDAEGCQRLITDQRLSGNTISSSHALRNEDQRRYLDIDLEGGFCLPVALNVC